MGQLKFRIGDAVLLKEVCCGDAETGSQECAWVAFFQFNYAAETCAWVFKSVLKARGWWCSWPNDTMLIHRKNSISWWHSTADLFAQTFHNSMRTSLHCNAHKLIISSLFIINHLSGICLYFMIYICCIFASFRSFNYLLQAKYFVLYFTSYFYILTVRRRWQWGGGRKGSQAAEIPTPTISKSFARDICGYLTAST